MTTRKVKKLAWIKWTAKKPCMEAEKFCCKISAHFSHHTSLPRHVSDVAKLIDGVSKQGIRRYDRKMFLMKSSRWQVAMRRMYSLDGRWNPSDARNYSSVVLQIRIVSNLFIALSIVWLNIADKSDVASSPNQRILWLPDTWMDCSWDFEPIGPMNNFNCL